MAELICLGEFISDGEKQAARSLQNELPDDWVVICNKTFVTPRRSSWEAHATSSAACSVTSVPRWDNMVGAVMKRAKPV